ncbi:cellulose synthase/poly-beta-1,6-N-acetylglucosamine synthase-like glycosyltransferase [Krasilnikovia cinnamomea]|uniref:Cellulose synthase/poly-beta-1,6-N-acetylglucosamine synthase-like glycosyltransferase n=1 Tax=Krasilnikovia cinnamomea TaxID=349313 RepID=A0A4Q7ZRX1_9ACTN|nr:glycosyltransferase family 2 protein [Krasilnikovia cinnamomea]RZU53907.1 cellulose synthase/poly-beta-1,6-N-acetylglucosamine synthase-like glycosyltransferase [Krasilnikovia cinnamomea]
MSPVPNPQPGAGTDGYSYSEYSMLAGPAEQPAQSTPYRVRMRRLARRRPIATVLITLFAFAFESTFFGWLLAAIDLPDSGLHPVLFGATIFMIVATVLIELFRLINVVTLCLSSLWARDPQPVVPDPALRVAFLTTIVPGKEPLEMVERTLVAAKDVRHAGEFDVWLLDEGDDPEVRAMCERIGVRHYTRHGLPRYNTPAGAYKARTKHGNYNSWVDRHGDAYDVFVSVDPDHVPQPNFCERLLGYFRDPDVAFVVGPQVYGNYDGVVTRWAESQQYLFHSLLQRAGNKRGIAMLVGTNNAVRISALRSIGGLQDSITEDMATSLVLHRTKNPETGRRWRSVYTPDVLAVGEGPSSWTDYFSQQHRWSRGTDEVVVRQFAKLCWRLGFGRALHYGLLMSYYPLTALAWVLGATVAVCYLLLGAKGVQVPQQVWLMLYVDAALFQIGLYVFNRRHNVSPHETAGSSGAAGMLISTLSTPIYVSSYFGALFGRKAGFVVTPKGDSTSPDRPRTFRHSLLWAAFFGALLAISPFLGHVDGAMWLWPSLNLVICLLPIAIWRVQATLARRRGAAPRIPTPTTMEKTFA